MGEHPFYIKTGLKREPEVPNGTGVPNNGT